nr:unnamed protein product [Digitaria exilis]
MATAAAPAPQPTPPPQAQQQQPSKEQQQKALAANAFRLKAIGDRIMAHLRGMGGVLAIAEFAHLVYAFARWAPPLAILNFLGFSAATRDRFRGLGW